LQGEAGHDRGILAEQEREAMNDASRQEHWEHVYTTKGESEVSWFQGNATPSLELMTLTGATPRSTVIDIGGGASRFVDALVEMGFQAVTVLDLSEAAIAVAKARLGSRANKVKWVVADVTTWEPQQVYDLWHDRAAFHFLTEEHDRMAYVARLSKAVKPDGHAIIATFAPEGPERCSGLPVARYDAESLGWVLGDAFELIETRRQHMTPWGSEQRFQFSVFRRALGG
jgi:2-polyprenyl-3-methyl-5-hydroxy-6-metoxy-1,4-benzoquinol methylase